MKEMKDYLIIRKGVELRRVASNSIMYVVADYHYSVFHLFHDENFMMPMSLKEVESLMAEQLCSNAKVFVRVGRSLIVNLSYLYYINLSKNYLVLLDGNMEKVELNASRASLKALMDLVENRTLPPAVTEEWFERTI